MKNIATVVHSKLETTEGLQEKVCLFSMIVVRHVFMQVDSYYVELVFLINEWINETQLI